MEQKGWNLRSLSDSLLQSVRDYGIKEVSMGQYETVCKKIVRFAAENGSDSYYPGLKDAYDTFVDLKFKNNSICYEYARFQHRVMRMLSSLAENGEIDFSCTPHCPRKYEVSAASKETIEKALDYHSLHGEARVEMSTVMRHFFKYAEEKTGEDSVAVTDELLMDFFTEELPYTNKGSMGRSLRAIKYLSVYLKANGGTGLRLDFTQLNARGSHIRAIPPYSQEDISRALSSVDTATPEGLRDYAIILLAFDTGLRGVDIRTLRLRDIDWNSGNIHLRQTKTNEPLILPLSGKVMNAVADYILNGRPECSFKEVFLTVKGPARPLEKRHYGFTSLSDKYFVEAAVDKVFRRGFHSIRRSFATELSEAGVELETISQLLGHRSTEEDKPYLSYNREQVAFCSMGFEEIPVSKGIYAGGGHCEDK